MKRASVLLAAALVAAGCVEKKSAAPHLDVVRVTFQPYMTSSALVIAKEKGYFRDEGIDIQFESLGGDEAIVALLTDRVDVHTGITTIGLMSAMQRNARARIVADKSNEDPVACSSEVLMARTTLFNERDLERDESYRGLQVGLTPNTPFDFLTERFLEAHGQTFDSVKVVNLPANSLLSAFQTGAIDIRIISEPQATQIAESGAGKVLAPVTAIAPRFQWGVVVYGARLLDREPELGTRFMRAYLRGVRKYREGKTADNIAVISSFTHLDPSLLGRMCWPTVNAGGAIDIASVEAFAQWAHRKGLIPAALQAPQLWDARFIQAARGSQ